MVDCVITFCIGLVAGLITGVVLSALNVIAKTWDKEDGDGTD